MPNLLEIASVTRYRLFMGVGGALLMAGLAAMIVTGNRDNAATCLLAASAMGFFAIFVSRVSWMSKNHHLVAFLCLLPLTVHMSIMTITSNLSYEMAISNLVILVLLCAVVDKRVWLNWLAAIWCTSVISSGWAVENPVMSPLTYTVLMTVAAIFVGLVVINFHEAQELLRRKISELHESQAFARVGSWELDLRTMRPSWSQATYQLLEMPPGEGIPDFRTLLVKSDANRDFVDQIQRFFEGADQYDARGQIVSGSGEHMWIHSRGTTFYEQGRPVRKFGVFSDVTSHVEREQALEEAKQVAESAAKARTHFLANMSHEIRTPMNGVIGMTSLLEQEPLSDNATHYVDVIKSCSDSLLTTINDILDFTKLDAGKVILEKRAFHLRKMLEDSISMVGKSIDDKGLELNLVGDALELDLVGDPLRLTQVLVNLLSNAVKFTQTGSITVRADRLHCQRSQNRLQIQVIDTGIGIDAETQGRLFSPFTQADASTTREYGGTGLGLTICEKLIGQMKGTLRLDSKPGYGTTFSIELSLPSASSSTNAEDIQTPPSPLSKDLRILLAEDNKVNQMVATRMLETLGLRPVIVENGLEVLDQLERNTFDIVLMDVQMPQLDGLGATQKIRKMQNIDQPQIIALTANAMQEDRERCISAGMNDFLSKPIRLKDLEAAIVTQQNGMTTASTLEA